VSAEPSRTRLLHFVLDDDTSGFFPQLAARHDRDRFEISFGTLRPTGERLGHALADLDIPTFSTGCTSRLQYAVGLARLFRHIRRSRPDILHTHLFDPSIVGLAAGTLARTPLRVLTRHYSDYHTRIDRRWHVRLDQLCTRLAHRVIAVSQHTADHMIRAEGAPASKIQVVLNGIDFARARLSSPDAPTRVRQELGVEGGVLLLIVARLHPEKGHTYLFRALPGLRKRLQGRALTLVVAGTGPFESAYREEVRALGCEDVVRFVGYRNDAPDLIAASDLLVLPSVAEAFGLVLAEALVLGTPVVATRVGGIPEIVRDGTDGILVPPGDSTALEDGIARLLTTRGLRERMADAGAERVRTLFDFERMVREYESVYDSFRKTPAAPPR